MDAAAFTSTSIIILGSDVSWQTGIARKLEVDSDTVRQWLDDGCTPGWVDARLASMICSAHIAPWPRDEWLMGNALHGDGSRRQYIMHLHPPRFVARVVAMSGEHKKPVPEELPADVMNGLVHNVDPATLLCEVDWIEPVRPGEETQWLEAAASALRHKDLRDE